MSMFTRSPRRREDANFSVGGIHAIHDAAYSRAGIRVVGFGRFYPDSTGTFVEQNWSFRTLSLPADVRQHSSLVRHLPAIATQLGARELLAPSPVQFNAQACAEPQLTTLVDVGGVTVKRGYEADICVLVKGQAFLVSVGGCAIGWMSHPGMDPSRVYSVAAGAHLGLMSVERGVIPNMAKALGLTASHMQEVHAGYAFPIEPTLYEHRWDHPDYGAQNKQRCEMLVERHGTQAVLEWDDPEKRKLGRIDLGWIIRAEYKALGIPSSHIHGTPSYDACLGSDGRPLWYTTRGPDRDSRNLAIVLHQ